MNFPLCLISFLLPCTCAHCQLWMAPEMSKQVRSVRVTVSQAIDMYSFGVMLWEGLELKLPWSMEKISFTHKIFRAVQGGRRPAVSAGASLGAPDGYVALMTDCWASCQTLLVAIEFTLQEGGTL